MIKFFLQHDIGKGLLAMAVERVTTGEAEAEYQNLVSDLVTPLLALEAHATPIREGQGPSQTQGVQEIASKIEPCAIAYASLKQCSDLKSKAAKKPDSAEGVSAVERCRSAWTKQQLLLFYTSSSLTSLSTCGLEECLQHFSYPTQLDSFCCGSEFRILRLQYFGCLGQVT